MNKNKNVSKKQRPPRSLFENRCAFMLQDLITKIHENIIPPGSYLPSEAELGRQYSLSRSSIRKVLEQLEIHIPLSRHQGKGIQVGQKSHLKELLNTGGSVLIILPFNYKESHNFFHTKDTLSAIEKELSKQHIHQEFYTLTTSDEFDANELLRVIHNKQIKMVVFINEIHPSLETVYDSLFLNNIAMLSLLRTPNNKNIATITINNYQVGQMGAKHFIEQNKTNLYTVSLPTRPNWATERVAGFTDYIHLKMPQMEVKHLVPTPFNEQMDKSQQSIQTGRLMGKKLLAENSKEAAIFCVNDAIAQGFFEIAQENEIQIPEDWSLIGCNNDMQYFELNLTSISKNTYQCGTLAAKVVGSYLNGELHNIWPIHYALKPLLFKRNSTRV